MNAPAVFKALADETRLRIVGLLMRYELNVGELVQALGMGQSRVSRHLRILTDCGLLAVRRDGLWAFYRAGQGQAERFLAAVAPFLAESLPAADVSRAETVLAQRAQETRRFFNAIATKWPNMRREVLGGLDLEGLVAHALPACDTAADLGCGPGELLNALSSKAAKVIGVDASQAMLDLARSRNPSPGVSLRVGELEHLPMADAEAQAAVMSLTLHHLTDPLAALREAHRVLAPGGRLVVVDFLKHQSEDMRDRFGDRWLGFSAEDMGLWLAKAGFFLRSTDIKPVKLGLELGFYQAERPQPGGTS